MELKDIITNKAALARALGMAESTVWNWVNLNAIPPRHVIKVANALDVEIHVLLPFAERKSAPPRVFKKNISDLDALLAAYRGEPYVGRLPEHAAKLVLVTWGDRFPLLYDTLTALSKGEITSKEAQERLGVAKSTLAGLRRRYGVVLPAAVKVKKPLGRYKEMASRRKDPVLGVISGRMSVVEAAQKHEISLRTLHRYIAEVLEPRKLNEISHWSRNFRAALAWEIDHAGFASTNGASTPEKWRQWTSSRALILPKRPVWPKVGEDLHKVSLRRLLILWLLDEMSLEEIAVRRGGPETVLEELFRGELRQMDMDGFSRSVNHRAAAAEVVAARESYFRKAT